LSYLKVAEVKDASITAITDIKVLPIYTYAYSEYAVCRVREIGLKSEKHLSENTIYHFYTIFKRFSGEHENFKKHSF